VFRSREILRSILERREPRLFVVVGPCSIHDVAAAREYADRLKGLADQVASTMLLVMRVYFEKPRTTIGWKGLINDPHLNGTHDMQLGLRLAQRQSCVRGTLPCEKTPYENFRHPCNSSASDHRLRAGATR